MDFEQEINALKTTVQTQAVMLQELSDRLQAESERRAQDFLQAAPVGTIAAFGGAKAPAGWLLCNGATYTAAQFPLLWEAIGTAWGGDRSQKTFHVPDLSGMFLRGVDSEGARDPERDGREAIRPGGNTGNQVGSWQRHQVLRHHHGVNDPGHTHGYNWLTHTGGPDIAGGAHCARFEDNRYRTTREGTGITIQEAGGTETRPVNASVYFCIRADSPR